mmetsp:Transcript_11042/g.20470  ORF Transcript_11042/g.20470 Transcript_11042/m.20470 type:complete len:127 (-) Transcript_11042:829-1209(-)
MPTEMKLFIFVMQQYHQSTNGAPEYTKSKDNHSNILASSVRGVKDNIEYTKHNDIIDDQEDLLGFTQNTAKFADSAGKKRSHKNQHGKEDVRNDKKCLSNIPRPAYVIILFWQVDWNRSIDKRVEA